MTICLAWDIDGTLLSQRPGVQGVFDDLVCDIADDLGVALPQIEATWGKTELQIFTELFGPDLAETALNRFEAGWTERWDPSHFVAHVGVAEALDALASPTHAHVIVTGNVRRRARDKVSAVGLDHHFDWERSAYGAESVYRGDLVGAILTRTDTPVIVIGDTPHDIDAARAHGAPVVAVATGNWDVAALTAEGADLVIPDFDAGRDAFLAFVDEYAD